MNEKQMFLKTWEREFQITLKVLKAYPANKLDFKPHGTFNVGQRTGLEFPD
jgi:hypothetical protein